jgi:hypothetical protein
LSALPALNPDRRGLDVDPAPVCGLRPLRGALLTVNVPNPRAPPVGLPQRLRDRLERSIERTRSRRF